MEKIDFYFSLLNLNYSLLTVGDNKQPSIKWKELQVNPLTKDQFENHFNNPNTKGIGIITGFNNLEVLDIDLKVILDLKERQEFWNEYLILLKDNIEDFENKFVIVKTKNNGFHILYKCSEIQGNQKIAKMPNAEALIETRGKGGYVYIYPNYFQKNYFEIVEITKEDRNILFSVSKLFDHVEEIRKPEQIYKNVEKQHFEQNTPVWEDYNNKTSVWDLISSEFNLLKKIKNKQPIKRIGATSVHSGYIFDNSKCLYLFSTGTKYPSETLLSPFYIYTIQKHNGDFKEAAKDLYKQGFGSRFKKIELPKSAKIEKQPEIITTDFPLDIYPDNLKSYILEIHRTLNASIDYLGSSFLWVLSCCIGNSIKIEVKKGWIEAGVIWLAIIGRAGIGKTHNIKAITKPLENLNYNEIKRYSDSKKKFDEYKAMDKKDKEFYPEVIEPIRTQFIGADITMEKLFELHNENKICFSILRDELTGWIKDLNKYRKGSDLETYLSFWSNSTALIDRKTSGNSYIPNSYVPIIGGVQPSIFNMTYETDENKDNGFLDRILICYPDLKVELFNDKELSEDLMKWYEEYIIALYQVVRENLTHYDDNGNINSLLLRFNDKSKELFKQYFNELTNLQNSENESEFLKSVYPKMKSYLARFALLLNVLYSYNDGSDMYFISEKSMKNAKKLIDYYIIMAKKNKFDTTESAELKTSLNGAKKNGKKSKKEQFYEMFEQNPDLNRSKTAELLDVSRRSINNWISEIENK